MESIIELRNTSTHFITEDYELLYAPLFQACVYNYCDKMLDFHKVDIKKHISQNFLVLSVYIDNFTDDTIRGKYTPIMAERILKEKENIYNLMLSNNSDFSISVETKLMLTKKASEADLTVSIDNNSESSIRIVKDMKNPNDLYKHTLKDIVSMVNKRLKQKEIILTKIKKGETVKSPFTKSDFGLFDKFYSIKQNNKFCFYYKLANRYGYNTSVVDFLVNEIEKDPLNIIIRLKKMQKKDNPRHM